ncbi:uncharacterized protein LOC124368834 isoform X1 [Homalodisca vitripennis]|uniref:uncharacterized protein LOC124368834 isoform X1 n=2 Tax=Homalodisca vitripennis TaxID=197043 RepID=UPI001EEAB2B6|nr:uncharacterized protein LOC124368834 isoform X1 [Homalodisca vitripennis]XP_046682209.1 uncharacterized protein LOC124368834 isoform X1 [Homalodisca vitripennis]XP_046682210.1 uncharacterized protein LOC124368834 isoform X1 [Homalodisca vitripennis]
MNESEQNEDEALEDDVEVDRESQQYKDKVEEIRCYLPTIQSLMIRCNDEEEDLVISRKTCVKKLSQLMKTFVSPKKKLAYSSMLKIERLLKSLTSKMKLQSRKSNGSPVNKSSSPQPSTSQDCTSSTPIPSTSRCDVSVFGVSSQKSEKVKLPEKLESDKGNSSKSSSTSQTSNKSSKRKKLSNEETSTFTESKFKKKNSSFKSSKKFEDTTRKTSQVSSLDKAKRFKFGTSENLEFSSGPQEFLNRSLTPRPVPRQFAPVYQRGPTHSPRFPQNRFPQPRYPEPRYSGPRYSAPRYPDVRYPEPMYAEPRYTRPRYSSDSKYPEVRFREPYQSRFPDPKSVERKFTTSGRNKYPLEKHGDLKALSSQVDLRHQQKARRRSLETREEPVLFSDEHIRIVRRQATVSPENEEEKSSAGDEDVEKPKKSLQQKRKFDDEEDKEETGFDTEWEKNTTFSKRRVGTSLSPDINLDALGKQDGNYQKDEDTINLEKSKRKLEVLMQNRLASMNAGRISCTISNITDNNRNLVTKGAEETSPCPLAVETVSPFSSTLDEMMSNLNAKYRTNRCQLNKNKEVENEKTSNTVKSVYNCDKANLCKKDKVNDKNENSHLSLENAQQSRSPPPVCSLLTGPNKVVPFLKDEDYDPGVTKLPWDNSNATKSKIDPEVPIAYEMCDKGEPTVSSNASQWQHSSKPNLELPDVSFLSKTKDFETTKDLEMKKDKEEESALSIPLHQKKVSDSTKSDFNTVKSVREQCNVNILSTFEKCDPTKRFDDKIQDPILNSPGKNLQRIR